MTDDAEPAVRPLEPDDEGQGTVNEAGTLYVGKAYAGEDVRWVIERLEGDDGA
jgi:hypothetical protein